MSAKRSGERDKASTNPQLKSSIVHKPFATGTLNFFNPHRKKTAAKSDRNNQDNKNSSQLTLPKLFLNAELEQPEAPPTELALRETKSVPEIEYRDTKWLNALTNPWSLGAIATILLANLISGAVIWRERLVTADSEAVPETLDFGSASLAEGEFVPLNLSTLSRLKTAEDLAEESTPKIEPISPALAPINNAAALSASDTEFYYILSEYRGDRSLVEARQQVPQVSIVNFPQGVFIYLGAFRDRDLAEQYLSQLEQEGLAAQIYPWE